MSVSQTGTGPHLFIGRALAAVISAVPVSHGLVLPTSAGRSPIAPRLIRAPQRVRLRPTHRRSSRATHRLGESFDGGPFDAELFADAPSGQFPRIDPTDDRDPVNVQPFRGVSGGYPVVHAANVTSEDNVSPLPLSGAIVPYRWTLWEPSSRGAKPLARVSRHSRPDAHGRVQ